MSRSRAAAMFIAAICAAATIGSTARAQSLGASLDESVYKQDIEALTRYAHRLSGVGEYTSERADAIQALMVDPPTEAKARAEEIDDQVERLLEVADNPDFIKSGPGSLAASAYIQNRLESIKRELVLDASNFRIFTQEFDVVQPITTECKLFVDGEEIQSDSPDKVALYALRPNALMASVTPAEGLEGESLYVGMGSLGDYGHNDADGKIVIVDYEGDWRLPFALGAKAVIIIGNDSPKWVATLHAYEPANLPRFYVTPEMGKKLKLTGVPRTLRIQAACQWRRFRGRNVIAVLRGTNARFDTTVGPEQTIVLAASLDSLSEVPAISPGARDAANCAGLLQLVEYLSADEPNRRPRRDIVFAFLDGQSQGHMGARAFYAAVHRPLTKGFTGPEGLTNKTVGLSFEERSEALNGELEFQTYASQILNQANIYEPDTAEMKDERDELKKTVSSNFFLSIGPLMLGRWYMVLTVVICVGAMVLSIISGRQQAEEEAAGVPAMIAARKLTSMVAMLMVLGLVYGLIDQVALAGMRAEHGEANKTVQAKIDNIEQDINGLAKSHRATMALLMELAREKNSDALNELRPRRVTMKRLTRVLGKARPVLSDLNEELARLTERAQASSGDEKDSLAAELAAKQLEVDEKLAEIAGYEAEIEVNLPDFIDLSVLDMVCNSALRIINKGWVPAEHAEELSKYLTSKNPQWQEMMRLEFVKQMVGDPESGTLGMFDQIKQDAIAGCRGRRSELIQQLADLKRARKIWDAIGPKTNSIALHLSLNLGDERSNWTFLHGDTSSALGSDQEGTYTDQVFKPILAVAEQVAEQVPDFDKRPLKSNESGLYGGISVDSSAIARLFGVYNMSVRTVLDQLPRQGQPFDTVERLDLDAGVLFGQLQQVATFLKALADNGKLAPAATVGPSAVLKEVTWNDDKSVGQKIDRTSAGAAMRTHPVSQAVVAVYGNLTWAEANKTIPGYVEQLIYMTDSKGHYTLGPGDAGKYTSPARFAATFDEPDSVGLARGQISGESNSAGSRGIIRYVSNVETVGKDLVTIVKVRSMTVVNYGFQRAAATTVMQDNATSGFAPTLHLLCEAGQTITVFVPFRARGVKMFNNGGIVILNNGSTPQLAEGVGISLNSLADEFSHPSALAHSANDLGNLNDSRLHVLFVNRINQKSLTEISGTARDMKDDAFEAGPEGLGMLKYVSDLVVSTSLSRRVYGPLKGVMNDLVKAVVLLLLLAMPFAFAMERLIIGTPHIYRQLSWFAIFFLSTFALLYMVNPAFRIAATPIIIFLAFTIILLSSMVIFILIRKLQVEVKRMQGLGATVHTTDVSRISTMGAAVMMGISTMRRRPLRTILTSVTVVLLTFTILTFASFGSSFGNRKTYKGPLASMPVRILVRDPLWAPMDAAVAEVLRGSLGERAEVVDRVWVSPSAADAQSAATSGLSLDKLLATADIKNIVEVSAAIGMDIRDVRRQPDIGKLFTESAKVELLESNGVFLTKAVAGQLELTDEDIGVAKLLLSGFEVIYAGIVTDHLASHRTIDGSNIVPVDYQISGGGAAFAKLAQKQVGGETGLEEQPEVEGAQFSAYGVDRIIILGAQFARTRLKGETRAVTVYPAGEAADVQAIAGEVAMFTRLPTYYGSSDGVFRMNFTTLSQESQFSDLVVPLVLGGLIIFATMLGSVADRKREIYTFSSLGLAPRHVATLFFAEASVYAIIGGMGGYLLGQTVARLLGWISSFEGISMTVPDINYSSSTAAWTIMIVMGTVMVSTIYPALKASRSANPGIQRSWQIPKPDGDLYDLIFPFTVSAYDITGVAGFLKEHFDNYTDTSLGIFATTNVRLFRQADSDMLGIVADMALSPFDLGVNQRFALLSQPSEIEGIDEIRILIYRLTGTNGDWRRANRTFINDLRRQLLIWRSLKTDVMDEYRNGTMEVWDSLPKEQIDDQTIGELT